MVSKIVWTLILAVIVVSFHAGFMFAKPVIDHKFFASDAAELMRYNFSNEDDAKKRFIALAAERNITLNPDDRDSIDVWKKSYDHYVVQVFYSITVDYYGLYQKTYKYEHEFTN
jgi:hypothetical protein